MLGVFAEFAAAKARGVYKGRPPSIDSARVAALKAEGLGATEMLGVSRRVGEAPANMAVSQR